MIALCKWWYLVDGTVITSPGRNDVLRDFYWAYKLSWSVTLKYATVFMCLFVCFLANARTRVVSSFDKLTETLKINRGSACYFYVNLKLFIILLHNNLNLLILIVFLCHTFENQTNSIIPIDFVYNLLYWQ